LPVLAGVLLFYQPAAPEAPASAEQTETANTLPATGSVLPLAGLLGALALTASLGLMAIRQKLTA
jgi:hypothetical protein